MAQVVRSDEVNRLLQEAKQFASSHPHDTALLILVTDLLMDTGHDDDSIAIATAALTAATVAVRSHRPISSVPMDRQQAASTITPCRNAIIPPVQLPT